MATGSVWAVETQHKDCGIMNGVPGNPLAGHQHHHPSISTHIQPQKAYQQDMMSPIVSTPLFPHANMARNRMRLLTVLNLMRPDVAMTKLKEALLMNDEVVDVLSRTVFTENEYPGTPPPQTPSHGV
ncbi:hypothetical protein SeMB42_g02238 [Synchytrium endobioticum]|uniref:Uncharacterized protein n=1 Tax=Synchytrium endobioticum TaxID=286115 RepID=A0A507DJB4_9FUNG|nr:hypothetical protein SeMB42_g02238 [Synchytrium endobioticum]TPX50998.1 hypothetical protein SeLEV6574_g00561 [Synchytrium endobioticum]